MKVCIGLIVKNPYFHCVKTRPNKEAKLNKALRQDILKAMIASFKIEGVTISAKDATSTLKKIEASLEI